MKTIIMKIISSQSQSVLTFSCIWKVRNLISTLCQFNSYILHWVIKPYTTWYAA